MDTNTRTYTTRTRYIARCTVKGCKAASSALAERDITSVTYYPSHMPPSTRRTESRPRLLDGAGWTIAYGAPRPPESLSCGHDRRVRVVAVKGRLNDEVACNAKCTGAIGPSCACSCGGENHGKGHAH